MRPGPAIAALLGALLASGTASAHERSTSHSRIVIDGAEARVELRIRAIDASYLEATGYGSEAALGAHLSRSLRLLRRREACDPDPASVTRLLAPSGWQRWEWRIRCDGAPDAVRSELLSSRGVHVHFARVRLEGPGAELERVLSERAPEAALLPPAEEERPGGWTAWVAVGVEHILLGADHLVFLGLLILLAGTLRETAVLVTGFTIGHSATLACATLGLASPDTATVEATIAVSIVLVAAENAWLADGRRDQLLPVLAVAVPAALAGLTGRMVYAGVAVFAACHLAACARDDLASRWRWMVATLFGLLHGFGFAGALGEAGVPADRVVPALLGFNIGVELGQLAVVAVVWPVLVAVRARGDASMRWPVRVGSALGMAAGTYWLLTRIA